MKAFYLKYKEYINYIIFGIGTMIVSQGTYALCAKVFGFEIALANAVSWICAVAFAYITNRTWVFEHKAHGTKGIIIEIIEFAAGRVATYFVETAIIEVTVRVFNWNELLMKFIAGVIATILNYIISKFIVFRKRKKT
ncbi:MAG: GtrA family protein [Lachnospiraceae bacterium]|nr:GtrA family protein [Lachnospiraceae bacterium]MBR6350525.1 GtrA family protein [Lachnospiraceae bacterium]